MMTFTEKQLISIKKCVEWFYLNSFKKNRFIIGGLAGTGKSTILSYAIEILGLGPNEVIFCTFTGKASLVLRMKGLHSNTIHKVFYNVRKNFDGSFLFSKKSKILSGVQLIVIDELSMVGQTMMEDILSFGIPVIGLGDPGQLPPIYGANKYISELDCFLTEVMRQDSISGILTLADMAREGKFIPCGNYGNSKVISVNDFDYEKEINNFDVILCWKNKTRISLNKFIRKNILKIDSIYPIAGDKLLCLENNYAYSLAIKPLSIDIFITNGLLGNTNEDAKKEEGHVSLKFYPDFNKNYDYDPNFFELKCDEKEFLKYADDYIEYSDEEEIIEELDCDEIVKVDYGYAFTVHKSQGSEWDNVLIIDEFKGSDDMRNKWLYTAITRGKKSVTILK